MILLFIKFGLLNFLPKPAQSLYLRTVGSDLLSCLQYSYFRPAAFHPLHYLALLPLSFIRHFGACRACLARYFQIFGERSVVLQFYGHCFVGHHWEQLWDNLNHYQLAAFGSSSLLNERWPQALCDEEVVFLQDLFLVRGRFASKEVIIRFFMSISLYCSHYYLQDSVDFDLEL